MVEWVQPTWGHFKLNLRIDRVNWVLNVFLGVLLPLILQGAFGQRLVEEERSRLLVGNLTLAALVVTFRKSALGLAADETLGRQALLSSTALTREGYLAATCLSAMTLGLVPLAFVGFSHVLLEIPVAVSWVWLLPYVLAVVVFSVMAIAANSFFKGSPNVALVANLVTVGSFVFCPLAYSVDRVPDWLAPFVSLLPATIAAQTIASGWNEGLLPYRELAVLGLWGCVFGALSYRFRWGGPR